MNVSYSIGSKPVVDFYSPVRTNKAPGPGSYDPVLLNKPPTYT